MAATPGCPSSGENRVKSRRTVNTFRSVTTSGSSMDGPGIHAGEAKIELDGTADGPIYPIAILHSACVAAIGLSDGRIIRAIAFEIGRPRREGPNHPRHHHDFAKGLDCWRATQADGLAFQDNSAFATAYPNMNSEGGRGRAKKLPGFRCLVPWPASLGSRRGNPVSRAAGPPFQNRISSARPRFSSENPMFLA